jgi:hypothetical protein
MSEEEEKIMITYIKDDFIRKGKKITGIDMKELILRFYKQIHHYRLRNVFDLKVGAAFLMRIKKNYDLFCGDDNIKINSNPNPNLQKIIDDYLYKCKVAYIRYGPKRIINVDETFWPLVAKQQQIIKIKNENCYKSETKTTNSYINKEGITLTVSVSASGQKLPLLFIVPGKTMKCTEKLKLNVKSEHYSYYSENGWMDETVFLYYLEKLSEQMKKVPCCLICDCYRAHLTDPIKKKAKRLNIELLYVPATTTAELQPLDYGVNGPLKNIYSKLWREHRLFNDEEITSKVAWSTASLHAIKSYKQIKSKVIVHVFNECLELPPTKEQTTNIENELSDKAIAKAEDENNYEHAY